MGGARTIREIAIIIGGFVIVGAAVGPMAMHWLSVQPDQRLVDLDVYRSGGQAVLRGAPVYDFMTQPPQLLPFTYPPLAVLLAVPLALVSWTVAQWAWVVLILVATAVAVRYAFAGLLDRFPTWRPLLIGVLVAVCAYPMPMRDQIRFGQVDIFLVAMCVADCVPGRTRWPRGLLVGLATAIKLVPGVFLVYFWITGRRREAMTAAVTAVVATLGTFLVLPADSADYWFRALFDSDRLGANAATANQSVRGMLLRLHLPGAVTAILWLVCVGLLAYVGFRSARRAALDGREATGVALTGLIAVLVSPVAWIHHMAWLVIVLGALTGDGRARRPIIMAAAVWLFFLPPLPWWGITMLADHIGPSFTARIVQDAFGLGIVALLFLLPRWAPFSLVVPESDRITTSRDEPKVGTLGE